MAGANSAKIYRQTAQPPGITPQEIISINELLHECQQLTPRHLKISLILTIILIANRSAHC